MNAWINCQPGPKLAQVVEKHGEALKERYHTEDVFFAIWMHAVNRAIQRRVMLSYDDLEDWGYWDAYDGDMSPRDAAIEALENAGWDSQYDVEVIG